MKILRWYFLVVIVLLSAEFVVLQAQGDLLRDFLGKEEPAFQTEIAPGKERGQVILTVYFTHSKTDRLEASFWIEEQQTRGVSDNQKKLISSLQVLQNRQVQSIAINDLHPDKSYNIGVDYRNPDALNKKFTAVFLINNFQYQDPGSTLAGGDKLSDKNIPQPVPTNCENPNIKIELAPTGYCNLSDKPAILIQCDNCEGRNWSFKVEVKRANSYWVPLRSDGMAQAAVGNNLRIEPLCDLGEGRYYARVSAWGENCTTPFIQELDKMIQVGAIQYPMTATAGTMVAKSATDLPPAYREIPQECEVQGKAFIQQNKITGNLVLEPNTPCASFNPYAEVRYIHPGYRDIILEPLPLYAGKTSPFEINLDERDLNRGIHTLQVIVFGRSSTMSEGVPIAAFWLKAETMPEGQPLPAPTTYDAPVNPGLPPISDPAINPDLWQTIDTISVRATDPNCNQIQNLQLVYDSNKSRIPLFISWLSPRCCQEKGCTYTVWAGSSPMETRLIVKGNKSGAIIRELLPGISPDDNYFEVVVETSNGNRKAAFLVGKGPIYGVEAVLDYQDAFSPQKSDPLIFEKAPTFTYKTPELSFSNFAPCKYKRQTWVTAERPVREGDPIRIQYDFKDTGHQYSLYFQPANSNDWVLAPDTRERQDTPIFEFAASPFHSGRYLVLVYKPSSNWGCLSESADKAVVLLVNPE